MPENPCAQTLYANPYAFENLPVRKMLAAAASALN